jgi:hypothetical protein
MPAPPPQQPDEAPQSVVREVGTERFGPLEVKRYVKADGRALLLFNRVEPAGGDPA